MVRCREMVEEEAERSPVVAAPVDPFRGHLEADQIQKDLQNQVVQNQTVHNPMVWEEQFEVER